MTDAAPERITVGVSWGEQYFDPSAPDMPETEYVRADLASAGVRRAEALAEAESDALTAAQARIAELEAALSLRTGADHDPDCKAHRDRSCNCGHDQARRALEAKP